MLLCALSSTLVVGQNLATGDTLLSAKASANTPNADGEAPLHEATSGKHVAVVERLLQSKAAVNQWNQSLWTPLHLAAQVGNAKSAEMLLFFGANVDAPGADSATPVLCAALFDQLDVLKLLIEHPHSFRRNPVVFGCHGKQPSNRSVSF